jgi:hypothetical protein
MTLGLINIFEISFQSNTIQKPVLEKTVINHPGFSVHHLQLFPVDGGVSVCYFF